SARRVDLLEGELDPVVEVGAGRRATAGQFDDVVDLDGGLRGGGPGNGQGHGGNQRPDVVFHPDSSLGSNIVSVGSHRPSRGLVRLTAVCAINEPNDNRRPKWRQGRL